MSSWTVLVITLLIQAMISAAALTGPVLAPDIASSVGLRADLVGIQVGIIYGAAAISSLASGDIIRKRGAVRVSQIALVFAAAGLTLSLTATATALVVGALLVGLGYGVVTPASSHLLSQTTPRHRMGLVFSLKQTGVPLGGILAALLLPPIALAANWKLAVGTFIALCLFVACIAEIVRNGLDADRAPAGRGSNMFRALRQLFTDSAMRGLALISFVFAAMQLILTGYLVTFLTEGRGLPLAIAGSVLAVAQAAGVGGRLLWGWSADRFLTARRVLAVLALLSSVCAGVFALEAETGTILVLGTVSTVFGAAAIGWNGVFLAEVARIAPRESVATATGAALFMTYAGVVVGPPAFAVLLSHSNYATAFSVASVIMAAMALVLFLGTAGTNIQLRKSAS